MANREQFNQPPRIKGEVGSRAAEANSLNAQMTPTQREAINTAGRLYRVYTVTDANGYTNSLGGVQEREIRVVAGALVRVANGLSEQEVEQEVPFFRNRASSLLEEKQ